MGFACGGAAAQVRAAARDQVRGPGAVRGRRQGRGAARRRLEGGVSSDAALSVSSPDVYGRLWRAGDLKGSIITPCCDFGRDYQQPLVFKPRGPVFAHPTYG